MTARQVRLQLKGLVAVHAVRAVHTALGGVSGIQSATVNMMGAEIDVVGNVPADDLSASIRRALEPIGVELEALIVLHERVLPIARASS